MKEFRVILICEWRGRNLYIRCVCSVVSYMGRIVFVAWRSCILEANICKKIFIGREEEKVVSGSRNVNIYIQFSKT